MTFGYFRIRRTGCFKRAHNRGLPAFAIRRRPESTERIRLLRWRWSVFLRQFFRLRRISGFGQMVEVFDSERWMLLREIQHLRVPIVKVLRVRSQGVDLTGDSVSRE